MLTYIQSYLSLSAEKEVRYVLGGRHTSVGGRLCTHCCNGLITIIIICVDAGGRKHIDQCISWKEVGVALKLL